MALQKVVTEEIAAAAGTLTQINNQLNNEVDNLQRIGSNLLSSWESAAGSAAQTTLCQLLKGNEARSAVLDNYINMLQQVVNPSYTSAEETNTKLSDMFL